MLIKIPDLLHNITHRHAYLMKPEVGEMLLCSPRLRRGVVMGFRPDFDGAEWHQVPETQWDDVLGTASATEAMAVLRAAA